MRSTGHPLRIAVFGLGYVGTVTAAGLAAQGHRVVGVDVDEHKVDLVRRGRSPVPERDLQTTVASGVSARLLTASLDPTEAMAGADLSFVCVGTASGAHGEADLTRVERTVADIRIAMDIAAPPESGHHSVVVRSTVPPGTVTRVVTPRFTGDLPHGWWVGTGMMPEFLREGSGLGDFYDPPLVVVGTEDVHTLAVMTELFGFLPQPVLGVGVDTAEGLKHPGNAYAVGGLPGGGGGGGSRTSARGRAVNAGALPRAARVVTETTRVLAEHAAGWG